MRDYSVNAAPICYDLFCGLGGWAEGFLSEGYCVIGFDIEAHDYGTGGYPGHLVLKDILALHGSQLKHAAVIVGSSPCQEFSVRAMPWKTSRAVKPKILPDWWKKTESQMTSAELAEWKAYRKANPCPPPLKGIELFQSQFRIQREASEAAGRYIPLIVENVRGAIPWVGQSRWHYGSFHLWGDVPALMPSSNQRMKYPAAAAERMWKDREIPRLNDSAKSHGQNWSRFTDTGEVSSHYRLAAAGLLADGTKGAVGGGSWFGTDRNDPREARMGRNRRTRREASGVGLEEKAEPG